MKTALPAVLILLAAGSTALTTGCSTTDRMRDARPTPPPGPDESKVIIYRTSYFGESAHFPIYEVQDGDGRLLGFTETECYFEILCPPGRHLFFTWGEGEAFIEATLEPGKTYFVRATSKFGILSPRPGLAPVRWEEVAEIWPSLRCRELDPAQAAEFTARHQDRLKESVLKPEDGTDHAVYPAK